MPEFSQTEIWIGVVVVAVIASVMLGFAISSVSHAGEQAKRKKKYLSLNEKRQRDYDTAEDDLDDARKKLEKHNTVVIDLIHDLGDDFVGRDQAEQQIAFDEALQNMSVIREVDEHSRIIVILHTLGGYARPAQMLATALKDHLRKSKVRKDRVVAYVPYVAMSGGTMIALACDKIVMGRSASLGPIDTIFGSFPAEAYKHLVDEKGILATQDLFVLLAHEAGKYEEYAKQVSREIINEHHKAEDKPENFLADHLSAGKMSHSQAISAKDAHDLGVNVTLKDDLMKSVYEYVDARIRMINTRIEKDEALAKQQEQHGGTAPPTTEPSDDGTVASSPDRMLERAIQQSLRGFVRW